jgi:cell fate regulator YaaT (PSP1 superfamily)
LRKPPIFTFQLKNSTMACASCSSADGSPRGCKSNGTCGTDSCNKLTVFDWLSNMQLPGGQEPFTLVEVRFKNSRKEYFRNEDKLPLKIGDLVATEASSGHDIGQVTLTGELVRFQLKKKKIKEDSEEVLKIYRMATQKDIDKWQTARDREAEVQKRAREMAIFLRLEMKISDVEFQGDGSKATFYYTAESRVDFRQLIKDMAQAFSVRIEMKQIGLRQEASRLGGIGSCGRELCCSTWLTDFRTVSTAAARYQQLSLNPEKLAGQCGKLKCCLNFELDAYRKALKTFPKLDAKLHTEKGTAVCQKTDIFKGYMWYAYKGDWMTWHLLTNEQAAEIIRKNKAKETVASLEEYALDLPPKTEEKVFENVVGQDSLNRFDRPKQSKNKRSSNNKSRNRNRNRKAPQKNE